MIEEVKQEKRKDGSVDENERKSMMEAKAYMEVKALRKHRQMTARAKDRAITMKENFPT